MILADTSVWIDYLRKTDALLASLLNTVQIVIHPFIIGELACGNLKNREVLLSLLKRLPAVSQATNEEVMYFIEHNRLMGHGVGFIDAHLLTAVALSRQTLLWTRDKRLAVLAEQLGLSFQEKGQ